MRHRAGHIIHNFLVGIRDFELNGESRRGYVFLSRPAGPAGLKELTKGESPATPLVMEMARAVIGRKGDDTSIITPDLDLVLYAADGGLVRIA
jgi:hypothetical protein